MLNCFPSTSRRAYLAATLLGSLVCSAVQAESPGRIDTSAANRGYRALTDKAFLPADFLSILRIADTLNSFSNNASSLGFRLFVLWPSALNFISLNPIIGSGGLGISQVPEIIGGVADNTIESVYIDTIFRYGIFFGLLVLGMYLLILLSLKIT